MGSCVCFSIYSAVILSVCFIQLQAYKEPIHPELYNKTTPQMAHEDGYPMETHYITTTDGYILGVHRIPYTLSSPQTSTPKPVVILHHGIAASSSVFFMNSESKRMPYILANAGYDVWLANNRGNLYSRNHTSLSPDEKPFWKFSCEEIALFDVPALIDYILDKTGQSKVSFIGQSMGSTVYLMLTSAIPSYNDKIQVAILLAPVSFASHIRSPAGVLLSPLVKDLGPETEEVVNLMIPPGTGEFFWNVPLFQKLAVVACAPFVFAYALCTLPMFVSFGFNYQQLNVSMTDYIWGHYPQGASINTFIHYAQFVNTGRFCKYDHGVEKNREIYNSDSPPDFELGNITAPLYLMAGPNDQLALPEDLETLRSRLTGVDESFIYIDLPNFNHMDFLLGTDANYYVNYPVLRILNEHNGLSDNE